MALKPPPKKAAGGAAPAAFNPLKKPGAPSVAAPSSTPAAKTPPPAKSPAASRSPVSPSSPKVPPTSRPVEVSRPGQTSGPATGKSQSGSAAQPQRLNIDPNAKLEEVAFAVPGVRSAKISTLFKNYQEKIAPKLKLADTSQQMLEAFSNIDVTAEKVGQILKNNQYYEAQFLRVIESYGKRESLPKLEAAVVLLGMQNSRNLIIAMQLLRGVRNSHPEWDKNGKLKVNPAEVLRYALRTEESLGGKKDSYSDTAYAAGLIYDLLSLISGHLELDKRVLGFIDSTYLHGLKTAQLGVELAKAIPDFGFTKFVFSSCLLHDVGKAVMAVSEPTYLDFLDEVGRRNLGRPIRLLAETSRYGVNHAMMGAICLEYFQMFEPVSRTILYHHDPYLLRSGKKGQGQLAALLCLATNIANNMKRTEKLDDPVIKECWKTRELQGFQIDTKAMLKAVARVV